MQSLPSGTDSQTNPILAKAPGWNSAEALKQLTSYAMENFSLPGEPGFPLNSVYASVGNNRVDAGSFVSLCVFSVACMRCQAHTVPTVEQTHSGRI